MYGQEKLRWFGSILLLFVILLPWRTDTSTLTWFTYIVWVTSLVCLAAASIVSLLISTLTAPKYDDAHVLVCRYLFNYIMDNIVGAYVTKHQEKESIHFKSTQEKFLLDTLAANAQTVYGRDHAFDKMLTVSDFRTHHPLTTYAHYESYVERVARGEDKVVLKVKPSRIALTSGTTGSRKLILASKKRQTRFLFKLGAMITYKLRTRYDPRQSPLQTVCIVYVHTKPRVSEGGIPMGPISMIQIPDFLYRMTFSAPPAGMRLTDEHTAMYVHLLFAIRDPTVKYISAFFSPIMFSFFSQLEEEWRDLVDDIRQGKVNARLEIDDDVREALESELVADPERASELEREFRKGFVGIARRIWPGMKYLLTISSGAAAVYYRRLEATYTKGIPLISSTYNASEGTIGTLYGEEHEYIGDASGIFYEFIPIEHSDDDEPDTLLAHEVEVGQTYEIAITTIDGLYRYRLGDVIKVTKFHHNAPIMDFQYRSGELLNLKGEKTPEVILRSAIMEIFSPLEQVLVDYTCAASVLYEDALGVSDLSKKVYYVIFVELKGTLEMNVDEITLQLDARLQDKAAGYAYQRKRDAIGRLKLLILHPGAFQELRAHILSNTVCASVGQMKIPRKLLKTEWIRLLVDSDIEK